MTLIRARCAVAVVESVDGFAAGTAPATAAVDVVLGIGTCAAPEPLDALPLAAVCAAVCCGAGGRFSFCHCSHNIIKENVKMTNKISRCVSFMRRSQFQIE
jgi:hypothetical protein